LRGLGVRFEVTEEFDCFFQVFHGFVVRIASCVLRNAYPNAERIMYNA
jgi:hypothetical protein